jgi:hypothetical protein
MNHKVKCLLFLYRCFACAAAASESERERVERPKYPLSLFPELEYLSPLLSFQSVHHIYSAVIISDIQRHAAAAFGIVRAQQNKYESILAHPHAAAC